MTMSWMCDFSFQRLTFNTRVLFDVCLLALITNTAVLANNATQFQVTEDGGVYYIKASVVISAPTDYVRNVLTDYVHIYRLNPSIVENEVLTSPHNDTARVRTKVLGCISSYCEEFERVEDVRVLASGDIRAEIVPEYSQFKYGITLWKIQPVGEHTRLIYEAEIQPGFFIPPLIGSYIVKSRLHDEITTSFIRLEKIANIQYERDWSNDWMVAENTVPCDLSDTRQQ